MRDRGVSTPLAYTLNLAVATVLLTGLVLGGTTFINDRREVVVRTELKVIGQQVASDVQHVDRLAQTNSSSWSTDDDIRIQSRYPTAAAGTTYTITLVNVTTAARTYTYLNLSAADVDVSVSVRVPTRTDIVDGSTATGGAITITAAVESGDGDPELVIGNVG